jgi:hypothetical protein
MSFILSAGNVRLVTAASCTLRMLTGEEKTVHLSSPLTDMLLRTHPEPARGPRVHAK